MAFKAGFLTSAEHLPAPVYLEAALVPHDDLTFHHHGSAGLGHGLSRQVAVFVSPAVLSSAAGLVSHDRSI
ncbi:MAG: hypothetical protein K0M60_13120 [Hydrogenophaga sp.]|nr:hypothetical protein [Hydrogenophaga sp.]